MYDSVVVGGGPIGSRAAYRLAEKGHRVLVLERKSRAGERVCCTGIIGKECADIFSVEERLILRQANSARIYSPSGNCLNLYRKEPQACILDRAAFDAAMAEYAQRAGADYSFNSRVKGVNIKSDHASVSVSRQGKDVEIQAKCVVIASGFTPGLLERSGLGKFGDFTIGAQAEVATTGADEVEVYFGDMAPKFFAWLVPTAPSMARVGLLSREKPGFYLKKWLAQLASQGKIKTAEAELCYGAVPLKPPHRTYNECLVAVGDAAGQVKPTSGGGIYYGLLGADIAAETLHRALEDGDLSARRLKQYEREWRKKLGRELKTGYRARKLFERLNDKQIDRIFETVKSTGIDTALLEAEDISFDWHSGAISGLLKHKMAAKAMDIIKLPFRGGWIDR